jgi:hypothetical protein
VKAVIVPNGFSCYEKDDAGIADCRET